jgi:ABC-type transport system involved in multi-copper enzyme maturation permease subunit
VTTEIPAPAIRPTWSAARDVFSISVERMLPRPRSFWVFVLLSLPVLLGLLLRIYPPKDLPLTGFELYGMVIALFFVRNLLPLVALLFGSALVSDAVDSKTLTYFLTRPISRLSIFLGEFMAYFVTVLTLTVPSVILTYLVLCVGTPQGTGFGAPDLIQDLGACALTLFTYGGVFALLGVSLKKPLLPGLLFLFVWEGFVANFPGDAPNYTLTAYARSLIRHRPAEEGLAELFSKFFGVGESVLVLGIVGVVSLGLAIWIFSRREYVISS